jgi:hypothetical protein
MSKDEMSDSDQLVSDLISDQDVVIQRNGDKWRIYVGMSKTKWIIALIALEAILLTLGGMNLDW